MIRFAYLLLVAVFALVGIVMSAHSAAPTTHSTATATATATATKAPAVESVQAAPAHDSTENLGATHLASGSIAALTMPVTAVAAAGVPALAFGADCADCALDAHTMTLLACAFLALLVTLVLVRPRLLVALFAPRVALRLAVARLADLAPALRPPDLLALGISRT